MVRRRLEPQTHVRAFRSDKVKLENFMRRKRINSQAMALRLLLKNVKNKR